MRLLVISCAAWPAVSGAAQYQVGDRAAADIITPVQLVVIDHDRSETLRHQEAQRVPAIFRFNTNSAAEAELKMLTAYTAAKEGFLKSLARAYKTNKLDAEVVAQERFGKAVASYQRQNRSFPLTTNLASIWALGESDQPVLEDLANTLRETMAEYIRADSLSASARLGPQQVRLVTVGSTDALSDLDGALAQSVGFYKTNFVPATRARKDLQAKFGPAEQWAGKFLAGFVRENCVCDEALTQQSRARRIDPILAADTYAAGTLIIKAGGLVDGKLKAALDELARRTEADLVKAQAADAQKQADAIAAGLERVAVEALAQKQKAEATATGFERVALEAQAQKRKAEATAATFARAALEDRQTKQRYLGGLLCVVFAASAGIWIVARRRQPDSLLPALAPGDSLAHTVISCPACHEQVEVSVPVIRERLLPELTRWVKTQFLQRLTRSHAALSETQRQAALQVAELERRLEEIKAPLQERLKAYEQRIVELEHQLAAKGAENRELLEATIKMARERLEARRNREAAWN